MKDYVTSITLEEIYIDITLKKEYTSSVHPIIVYHTKDEDNKYL